MTARATVCPALHSRGGPDVAATLVTARTRPLIQAATGFSPLNRPALEWTLSRVVVEPVTEPIARPATAILAEAGLPGHRHAIDAMLSVTALAAPGPVTVLTSDPEDIATLCGRNVTVIKVLRGGPGN